MLLEETVYLGSDNLIVLALRLDSQTIVHTLDTAPDTITDLHTHPAIIRVVLTVNKIIDDATDTDMTIDSSIDASLFDFATDPTIIKIKLGGKAIKAGRHITKIKIYDSFGNYNWGDIMLVVKS